MYCCCLCGSVIGKQSYVQASQPSLSPMSAAQAPYPRVIDLEDSITQIVLETLCEQLTSHGVLPVAKSSMMGHLPQVSSQISSSRPNESSITANALSNIPLRPSSIEIYVHEDNIMERFAVGLQISRSADALLARDLTRVLEGL
jgi:hypothetical protein